MTATSGAIDAYADVVSYWRAARDGDLAALSALALAGPDIAARELVARQDNKVSMDDNRTALMIAAVEGHAECVRFLLPLSDPHARDDDQNTALMFAAYRGHLETLSILIPVSDLNALDSNGVSPVAWAAARGNFQCARLLLADSRCDARAFSSTEGFVLEHIADFECPSGIELLAPFFSAEEKSAAFRAALDMESWECADLLSAHAAPADAKRARNLVRSGRLPIFAARLEAEALQTVLFPCVSIEATGAVAGLAPPQSETMKGLPAKRRPRSL